MRILKSAQILVASALFLSLSACHSSAFRDCYSFLFGHFEDKCEKSCSGDGGYGGHDGYDGHGGGWNNGGDWNNDNNWNNNNNNYGNNDNNWNNNNNNYGNNDNNWNNNNNYGTAESGSADTGRDLIADVVEHSDAQVLAAGKKVADQFALSEDTGIHIARTMNSWAAVASKRSLTDADIADFSKRLYGIEIGQAKEALVKAKAGDKSGFEKASADIGRYWGTSPETVKTIFKTWYKEELKNFNIQ